MDTLYIFNTLQKIWIKVEDAKKLIDEGKEVYCSNKLQGALTNLAQIIEELGQDIKDNVGEKS